MSDKRNIKIENILESQIPSFLNLESPLFKEFLNQYYISQTHFTGILDVANHLNEYKNIDTYSSERFFTKYSQNKCYLIDPILFYDEDIIVNSTEGFPDKYGLIQIDNEIITYTGVTENSFTGCIRGFSGISEINDTQDETGLVFSLTSAEDHSSKAEVKNLNLIFYSKLFEKFKSHYLPDFEGRELNSKVDLELLLSRARDFYLTKGTDVSYKILFGVLYDDNVSVFKPKEYVVRASDDLNLVTKNILVEPINDEGQGSFIPKDLIGLTITQNINEDVVASASIYNAQYRPTDDMFLYELSLDSDSFIYNFIPTKKTTITEKLEDSILVDSTVGFPSSGSLKVKVKVNDTFSYTTLNYSGKTINQFLNITGITSSSYSTIKENDELIEDNLLEIIIEDGTTLKFRLLNIIDEFDYSETNTCRVNDDIFLSSFGDNFSDLPEYNSWIYNYQTYHNIKSLNREGSLVQIVLYDSLDFLINEKIKIVNENNEEIEKEVKDIISNNEILVNDTSSINVNNLNQRIKRTIEKTSLNPKISSYIQNSYKNLENDNLVVMSSGIPPSYPEDLILNNYKFNITGINSIFTTRDTSLQSGNIPIDHNLSSGNRVYLDINSLYIDNTTGISTIAVKNQTKTLQSGFYYVKKISDSSISLYLSSVDLYLSYSPSNLSGFSNPIEIVSSSEIGVGTIYLYNYNDIEKTLVRRTNSIGKKVIVEENKVVEKTYDSQLLMKEFSIYDSLKENKIDSSLQIYTIEDAYKEFKE